MKKIFLGLYALLLFSATSFSQGKVVIKTGTTRQVAVVLSSNTQLSNTGSTTENTVFTGTIPANTIGINGHLEIVALVTVPNNANTKTFRVKLNSTNTVISRAIGTGTGIERWLYIIFNRNSQTSQIAPTNSSVLAIQPGTSTSAGFTSYTVDFTADVTLTITCQNSVGTDTMTVEAFDVIAYP